MTSCKFIPDKYRKERKREIPKQTERGRARQSVKKKKREINREKQIHTDNY